MYNFRSDDEDNQPERTIHPLPRDDVSKKVPTMADLFKLNPKTAVHRTRLSMNILATHLQLHLNLQPLLVAPNIASKWQVPSGDVTYGIKNYPGCTLHYVSPDNMPTSTLQKWPMTTSEHHQWSSIHQNPAMSWTP
jgi:hypothetical protein